MLYLGIDLHAKQWTVDLGDEAGRLVLHRQVSTQPEQLRKFLSQLQSLAQDEGGFLAVLEVCGFHDYAVELLREFGCDDVVLVQPAEKARHKTDRRDARRLRELLWLNRAGLQEGRLPGLRRVRIASPQAAADRQVTALRKRLTKSRTQTVNKIHRLLKKHNLQHQLPTKGVQTQKARRWLEQLALPPIDRLEMNCLLAQWSLWEEQLQLVEKQIQDRQPQDENAQLLRSVPGLGAFGSLAVSSRTGDIADFPQPASLANYWGLTPDCDNSGDQRRTGAITKRGSAMVRYVLGQAVLHVLRKDPWMRKWYQRVKRRRGAKIARVAVMRRLATIIGSMLRHRLPYIAGGPEALHKQRALQRAFQAAHHAGQGQPALAR